jgi:lysophospholipase L1-like esterase
MSKPAFRIVQAIILFAMAGALCAQQKPSNQDNRLDQEKSAEPSRGQTQNPVAAAKTVTIFLAGDSTMSNKEVKAYPETGWGMPFAGFFDSSVTVDNRAKNGRSTRTFISEGLWQGIVDDLREGDYVFIQFGHNDEVKEKVDRYTTPEEFRANLTRFVKEVRTKKANPILLTPVTRRRFDTAGHITETHEVYSALVRAVAQEQGVPLIDLDRKSQALLQQYGAENSRLLFNWLEPGEHPNYPEGKRDDTHFNELGARKIAELVLAGVKELHLALSERIHRVSAVAP